MAFSPEILNLSVFRGEFADDLRVADRQKYRRAVGLQANRRKGLRSFSFKG